MIIDMQANKPEFKHLKPQMKKVNKSGVQFDEQGATAQKAKRYGDSALGSRRGLKNCWLQRRMSWKISGINMKKTSWKMSLSWIMNGLQTSLHFSILLLKLLGIYEEAFSQSVSLLSNWLWDIANSC